MKRKRLLIGILIPIVLTAATFGLWQLGRGILASFTAGAAAPTMPARLVTRIDVGVYPVDPDASRIYTSQSDLTHLLGLLRDVASEDPAPDAPNPGDAASFYTITLTYASGSSTICYLLEDRFVCLDDDGWYLAQPHIVEQLRAYLAGHPGSQTP